MCVRNGLLRLRHPRRSIASFTAAAVAVASAVVTAAALATALPARQGAAAAAAVAAFPAALPATASASAARVRVRRSVVCRGRRQLRRPARLPTDALRQRHGWGVVREGRHHLRNRLPRPQRRRSRQLDQLVLLLVATAAAAAAAVCPIGDLYDRGRL